MRERILVAMSGGVDSSVAAALLKHRKFDVIGATIRTWPKEECSSSKAKACCSLEAITRARAVAESLKIPYYVFDYSRQFKEKVIDYFTAEYLAGRTPNPCAICNEAIKFGVLYEKARELGAKKIATGHYAITLFDRKSDRFILREGKDKSKDQSYFLFRLSQDALRNSVFPLGGMTKSKVVSVARRMKLKSYGAPSSQDICFISDGDYGEYIRKRAGLKIEPGEIVDETGNVLGSHKGIIYYTIGQRRGLGIAHKEPLYVTAIDVAGNKVVVGARKRIFKRRVTVSDVNWVSIGGLDAPLTVLARIRYNQKKSKAILSKISDTSVMAEFDEPQSAPTPGQAVVFYRRDVVLGGGWIEEAE